MKTERRENRLRRRAKRLRRDLQALARFEYGSATPGKSGWTQRWNETEGLRVLMFAPRDYAGSLSRLAEAVNRETEHAVRCVVGRPHPYGYEHDLVIPGSLMAESEGLERLLAEADLIHVKDEVGFFDGSNDLPPDLLARAGKPLVYTHYGGYARKQSDDPAYQEYVRGFAARIALTPDLAFGWAEWALVPFPIDTSAYRPAWSDVRRIAHSPSTPERKGTDLFLAATSGLEDIEVDLIHGVSHQECMERKSRAGLFFDQAGRESPDLLGVDTVIGWYGNSAVEAMALGVPTIAHLAPEALTTARRLVPAMESVPVLDTPRSAEGLRALIETYFGLTPDERLELSRRTRQWAEEVHSYPAVAAVLAAVYERVAGPVSPPA